VYFHDEIVNGANTLEKYWQLISIFLEYYFDTE